MNRTKLWVTLIAIVAIAVLLIRMASLGPPEPVPEAGVERIVAAETGEDEAEDAVFDPVESLDRQQAAEVSPEPVVPDPEPKPALRVPTGKPAAGTLEIVATESGAPLDGVTVFVHRTRSYWFERDFEPDPEHTLTLQLDAEGRAMATGLEPADYNVALQLKDGQFHQRRVRMPAEEGRRAEFSLGRATVSGSVVDADGAAVEGACVTADLVSRTSGSITLMTWTDANGMYGLDYLPAGEHPMRAYLDGSRYGEADYKAEASLAEFESAEVNFGLGIEWVTWSGTLRNRAGDAVERQGRSRPVVRISRTADRWSHTLALGDDGTFSERIKPGVYSAWARGPGSQERHAAVDSLAIEADLEHDIVLPGTRVSGTVRGTNTGALIRSTEERPRAVRAHQRDHMYPAAFVSVDIGADGAFCFDGLIPGDWRVGVAGDGLDVMIDVSVRAEDKELTISLETPKDGS